MKARVERSAVEVALLDAAQAASDPLRQALREAVSELYSRTAVAAQLGVVPVALEGAAFDAVAMTAGDAMATQAGTLRAVIAVLEVAARFYELGLDGSSKVGDIRFSLTQAGYAVADLQGVFS